MTEVKRFQEMETMNILLSHLGNKAEMTDRKLALQRAVDKVVCCFVSLPPKRQTGLQLLQIMGEEWKKESSFLSIPKHIFEQISAKIIQQLLRNLLHDLNHIQNLGYQEVNGIRGHLLINKEGRRQIHVYLVDESLPKICKVYEWYLTAHAHQDKVEADEVVVHFLLEEKQLAFSAPSTVSTAANLEPKS